MNVFRDARLCATYMQKALMQMNVPLHHVVTDVTGVTGLRIIRAIISAIQALRTTG